MTNFIPQYLGSVVSITKGKKHRIADSPSDKAKRLIGIDDLRNDDMIRYTDDASGIEVIADDVLIAWDGANAGTIGFGKSGYIGSTIARLRVRADISLFTPFLGMYLKSKFNYLRQTATGATIPHINRNALESIPLPAIEFENQIRIAHLLGKVEGLITKRKQHLLQLDELLKSVFLQMFGPSSKNYDTWPLVEIRDLAAKHKGAMRTGPFGSNLLHSEFTAEGDVAVLGIDNAVQNRFEWGGRRFISNEKYRELESYRIYPDDVIITIMGTIGRSAVVPIDIPLAINTKHLAAITLNKEIANPLFLSYSIHSSPFILSQFKSKNRGAIMSGLNLGLIKETKLKRPPIELQNKFAETHTCVDKLKAMYQRSLNELSTLYAALSQQAFKGELDFSRVPLPGESALENESMSLTSALAHPTDTAIHLADINKLLDFVQGPVRKHDILKYWLGSYHAQLGKSVFSLRRFMSAAQSEMEKLRSDADEGLDSGDYDYIKTWVFEALKDGSLTQLQDVTEFDQDGQPIFGNHIQLMATQP